MTQDHDAEPYEPESPPFADAPPRRRSLFTRPSVAGFVTLAVLAGFGGVVVYAYHKGKEAGGEHVVPIIQASDGPIRVRPDDPGGMAVPDRDKEIYGRLAGDMPERGIERLLPPPEMPAIRAPDQPVIGAVPELPDARDAAPPAGDPPVPSPETVAEGAPPVAAAAEPPPTAAAEPPTVAAAAEAPAPAPAARRPASAPPRQATANEPPRQQARATPAAGAGSWRVQLGALRSESAARARWSELQAAHAPLLRALELRIDRADLGQGKGIFYRLQAGPVSDGDAAKRLCEALKERQLGCFVVAP